MSRMYLIRRGLHTFVGPHTLSELKAEFKRMSFGIQDEVSGHCGPWVVMENVEALRKVYPEIAKVVHEGMQDTWRVSDPGKKIQSEHHRKVRVAKRRQAMLALAFLGLAMLAAAAAFLLASGGNTLSSKAESSRDGHDASTSQLMGYIQRGEWREFSAFMQAHSQEMIGRISRGRDSSGETLSFLRAYAFMQDGTVEGLNAKVLRGNATVLAPLDCSEKTWRKKWREGVRQWSQLSTGRLLPRSNWARILAWDPHWIRRRASKGWVVPESYYSGCLMMAQRALINVRAEYQSGGANGDGEFPQAEFVAMSRRLQWILDVTREGQSQQALQSLSAKTGDLGPVFNIWNCFESAENVASLNQCSDQTPSKISGEIAAYNEERYSANLLRLYLRPNSFDASHLGDLRARWPRLVNGDSFTKGDYAAEMRYFRTQLRQEAWPEAPTGERNGAETSDVNVTR